MLLFWELVLREDLDVAAVVLDDVEDADGATLTAVCATGLLPAATVWATGRPAATTAAAACGMLVSLATVLTVLTLGLRAPVVVVACSASAPLEVETEPERI